MVPINSIEWMAWYGDEGDRFWLDLNGTDAIFCGGDNIRQWIADNGGYPVEKHIPFDVSNGMAQINVGGRIESWPIIAPSELTSEAWLAAKLA